MNVQRPVIVAFAGIVLACLLAVLVATYARSAHPPALPQSAPASDRVAQETAHAFDQPIIFFKEDAHILVFYPNGDIIHRGRKVTTDRAVVQALQEILALSPCQQTPER